MWIDAHKKQPSYTHVDIQHPQLIYLVNLWKEGMSVYTLAACVWLCGCMWIVLAPECISMRGLM